MSWPRFENAVVFSECECVTVQSWRARTCGGSGRHMQACCLVPSEAHSACKPTHSSRVRNGNEG